MTRARDIANLGNNTTNLETLDTLYGDNVLTGRNMVINGNFSVFQRGTSATTVSGNDIFAADRFKGWANGGGTFTVEQSTDVPNNEFEFSAKLTNTATDSSVAAGDNYRWATDLEGYTVSRLAYGHSDAKAVTLSFWVKSSLTGTYCGALYSVTASRHYIYEYTISSANTWEKKTITVSSGDTTGSWNRTNGNGLRVYWGFGSGTTYQGTAGAWTAGEKWETSSQAAWIGSASATFYITGVQLEVGETATPFEHEDYGTTLKKCKRYYQVYDNIQGMTLHCYNTSHAYTSIQYPDGIMRATPTATVNYSSGDSFALAGSGKTISAREIVGVKPNVFMFKLTASSLTAGQAGHYDKDSTNIFQFDAEL